MKKIIAKPEPSAPPLGAEKWTQAGKRAAAAQANTERPVQVPTRGASKLDSRKEAARDLHKGGMIRTQHNVVMGKRPKR